MPRIGLISFAHMHGLSYAEKLSRHPGVTLAGAWDGDADRGRRIAGRLGMDRVHASLDELLSRDDVDAVVVCSENVHHAAHTIAAAEAGKHVLCEKPLATASADAAAMVRAAEKAGVVLMTAFPCRFHPAALRTRRAIEKGDAGRVLAVNGTNHGKNPGGWFVDPDLAGGGAIADHTVHVVDLLRWMTGQEVKEVYAEATRFDADLPVEDGAILSLAFDDFIATQDASWSRPPSFPVWGDVTLEIIGESGVLSMDLFAQEHTIVRESDARVIGENWGDDMDLGLVQEFVAAIDGGRKPSVSGVDGLRAVEVVEAAYRSAASHRPEAVEHRELQ